MACFVSWWYLFWWYLLIRCVACLPVAGFLCRYVLLMPVPPSSPVAHCKVGERYSRVAGLCKRDGCDCKQAPKDERRRGQIATDWLSEEGSSISRILFMRQAFTPRQQQNELQGLCCWASLQVWDHAAAVSLRCRRQRRRPRRKQSRPAPRLRWPAPAPAPSTGGPCCCQRPGPGRWHRRWRSRRQWPGRWPGRRRQPRRR